MPAAANEVMEIASRVVATLKQIAQLAGHCWHSYLLIEASMTTGYYSFAQFNLQVGN